jgi:Dyp-type peroxidase family
VAGDDPRQLQDEVDRLGATLQKIPGAADAGSGLELIYDQRGNTLPEALRGHEHFGFKDGVSQPAVRGRISSAPDDFFTPRYVDPSDPRALNFAAPGDALVYPGQFVFGYELQNRSGDGGVPFDPETFPAWAKNGSYLVFRRLRQDVAAFRAAMSQKAAELASKPGFSGMTADLLASKLVGRWPSGAPVSRSPDSDNAPLGANDFANNHFAFQNASTPLPLQNAPPHVPDTFPQAPADSEGLLCPHAGHIRKVNPRDLPTDTGGASDTLARRILRRGIPYGDPLPPGADPASRESHLDRGLLFVCYQTSIVDQFEFLLNHWVNTTGAPEQGGFDIVIGQSGAGAQRDRSVELSTSGNPSQSLTFQPEWVVPTGGGYFFAPSIEALSTVLSA